MRYRFVSSLLALAMLLGMQANLFALSPEQLQSIHAAVIATGDEAALEAFELLKTEGVLDTSGTPAQDILKELSFQVLEVNKEAVTAAFMMLRRLEVFEAAEPVQPPPPASLTPQQRADVEAAARYLEDVRGTLYRLDPLYDEFQSAWTGIGQRKALNKMDRVLQTANSYIDYAQRSLRRLKGVDHPEVARVRAHEGEIIDRYNSWVNWVNRIWRRFEQL